MFYIDGISLSRIKDELKKELFGKKINKITRNTEMSLSLHFGGKELVFSCDASFPICYITDEKEEVLENSSGLCDTLRKRIINSELYDVEQLGYDRILAFRLSKLDELGSKKDYSIYFEIMGKYSNFILTDENNKIIDLLKRFSLEENRLRNLFPGVEYEQPIIVEKISPLSVNKDLFDKLIAEKNFIQKVEGIGKLLLENCTSYERYYDILHKKNLPKLFYNNDKIVLGTVLDIVPKEYDRFSEFSSFNEIINYYIKEQNLSQSFDVMKNKLLDVVNKKIKKDNNILNIIEKECKSKEDYQKYKEQGDILASVLYNVKKGMKSINTYDFYNNCDIEIPLDERLYPNENVDKIYKKYNKAKRTIEANKARKEQLEKDLYYFNSLKLFIENSKTSENLKSIYDEILSQKIIKSNDNLFGKKSQKKSLKSYTKLFTYGEIVYNNVKILYGRNNIENDNLTFKVADRDDIWLHAKNIPGSHVILKGVNQKDITDEVINKGAQIAAFYSKANPGDKVLIDYTMKKNINKPRGAKPGFVTYVGEKGIVMIKPEKL